MNNEQKTALVELVQNELKELNETHCSDERLQKLVTEKKLFWANVIEAIEPRSSYRSWRD